MYSLAKVLSCVSPGLESHHSLLSRKTAPSARRCLTLRATRPAHCIASPLARAPAVLPLASSYPSSHPLGEMPAARHTTCCLGRRRLQHRVLMASAVFSSLVPSYSQLHEARATTTASGSRSFCRHFPHRARLNLSWAGAFGPEVRAGFSDRRCQRFR
jgi:hypothetical protein